MYKVTNTFNGHISTHRTERGAVKAYEAQCDAMGQFAHYVKVTSGDERLVCVGGELFTADQYFDKEEPCAQA